MALIFLFSGISALFWDKYVFPRLRADEWFGRLSLVKKGIEDTLIINKTEQITVNEDQSIAKFIGKPVSATVEIVEERENPTKPAASVKEEKFSSGVIVTADGLVVSFDGGSFSKEKKYKIFSSDGRAFGGKLLFVDGYTNLAFFKIDGGSNFPTAEFVSKEDIKTGTKIVAIGKNGFDAGNSFKLGILEEFDKNFSLAGKLASSEKMQGALSVDANFSDGDVAGFSGGAAVDFNGNVVGILGAKKEEGSMEFFAIPADVVQEIVGKYIEKGGIERGKLGVYYVLNSKESTSPSDPAAGHGAIVYSASLQQGLAVITGSAAEKAGLRIFDVVLNVDGEEVNADQNLAQLISKRRPGEEVNLKILRDGKEMELKVVLQ
jgi:S1-C subfamily serine protease